ncbi:MAG: hypothetical protein ACI4UM_04940 [Succinivibrio sp.]
MKNQQYTESNRISVNASAFSKSETDLCKSSPEKKYNVKFDNDDLVLLNALQDHYGIKTKSDLIETILSAYLKNSLHEEGVAADVSLAIGLIADAYCQKNGARSRVSSWTDEVAAVPYYVSSVLTYGPSGKKSGDEHEGVNHSDSFLQVGVKLLQFCEREDLISSSQYKMLFKSLEKWNLLTKYQRNQRGRA